MIAPLNEVGDREGCVLENGVVRTPTGFKDAFDQMKEGGWTALDCDPDYGGQGMPVLLGTAVGELFSGANQAFTMYQGLTHGAYSAIHAHGSDAQKAKWLPKMVSCDWTGTMNLTEPHCGTDLGLMRTKAVPQEDGLLQDLGPEDLHLRRRSRHVRQRHPSGARQDPGRPGGHQGRLALHRAEIPCRCDDGNVGTAQRRLRRQARREDGHPRQLHLRDEL